MSETTREVEVGGAETAGADAPVSRPRLIFFYSNASGPCRRTEGYLAQVLQRRHNHETFDLTRVSVDRHPELATRFRVDLVPTILVVQDRKVRKRIVAPKGPRLLASLLQPWLR